MESRLGATPVVLDLVDGDFDVHDQHDDLVLAVSVVERREVCEVVEPYIETSELSFTGHRVEDCSHKDAVWAPLIREVCTEREGHVGFAEWEPFRRDDGAVASLVVACTTSFP